MEFHPPEINYILAAPFIVVAVTGMLLMFLELFVPAFVKRWAAWIAMLGLALSFILNGGTLGAAWGDF